MSDFDKEVIPLECPNPKCRKPIKATVYDLYSRGKFKCSSCGSDIEIKSSGASAIRSAISDIGRSQQKEQEAEKETRRLMQRLAEVVSKAVESASRTIKLK